MRRRIITSGSSAIGLVLRGQDTPEPLIGDRYRQHTEWPRSGVITAPPGRVAGAHRDARRWRQAEGVIVWLMGRGLKHATAAGRPVHTGWTKASTPMFDSGHSGFLFAYQVARIRTKLALTLARPVPPIFALAHLSVAAAGPGRARELVGLSGTGIAGRMTSGRQAMPRAGRST